MHPGQCDEARIDVPGDGNVEYVVTLQASGGLYFNGGCTSQSKTWRLAGRSQYYIFFAVWACDGHTRGVLTAQMRRADSEESLSTSIRRVTIAPEPTPTPTPTPTATPIPTPHPDVPRPTARPVEPPPPLEPPFSEGRPCGAAFAVRSQNSRNDWYRDQTLTNGVRTVSMSVMYASFQSDGDVAVGFVDSIITALMFHTGEPAPPTNDVPTGVGIKCAFGWVATATSDRRSEITLSGQYYDDREGSVAAGPAVPGVSCTGEKCSLKGEVFEFPLGSVTFDMYMSGSHSISSDGQTLSFERSGGVDLQTGLYVRFPGSP